MANSSSWQLVLELLKQQPLGVLGTNHQGHPYASLVAFVTTEDAHSVFFATTRATRKYHNLSKDEQIALLIDNRHNQSSGFYQTAAVTAYGRALEVDPAERAEVASLYLVKHPQLKSFVLSPSTALFRITVESYHLVVRFQHVTEFRMAACPA
jgi:nitroimidazol reductase NimA-like FMN-containing flavoprotein (pyridoxamine 5'-phosphate oxidase superfamily)